MAALVIYIIKWAVSLTLLYSLYGLFLRRETFHSLNRIVLLGIMVVSMVLPLMHFTTSRPTVVNEKVEGFTQMVSKESRSEMLGAWTATSSQPKKAEQTDVASTETWSVTRILIIVYAVGAVAFWLAYLFSIVRFALLLHRARRVECVNVPRWVHVVESREVQNSCSWMRWVVLSPNDMGSTDIIKHECAHLRRGHSWDKLLCEFTCRTLWFLPFAWMLRQDLADVHEFEADRAVLRSGADKVEYNMLLIEKAALTGLQPVTNAFNESKLKKRMIMMFKKKSTRLSALKALYVLPLAAFTVVAFAKPEVMDEVEEEVKRTLPQPLPVREESSHSDLQETVTVTSALPSIVSDSISNHTPPSQGGDGGEFVTALLDSTMTAIGAQKIGDGVYVGRFEPNFSSDTIRVATVWLDDEQSEHTHEYRFREAAEGTYNIDLQWEDREHLGRGWHIRWMKPAVEADAQRQQYHRQPVSYHRPLFMLPGEVPNAEKLPTEKGWLEQTDSETHFVLPVPAKIVKLGNFTLHTRRACLLDPETGDKYMCRGVRIYSGDGEYLAQDVSFETEVDDNMLLMATLVFPPLDKSVKRIALYDYETSEMTDFYNVDEITRKPIQIIP